MAEKKKRGRPKGSGIDDQRRLKDIARLMAAEPELKPTTAIRSLGHSNPSVVRRLRDKLNADFVRLLAEARRDLGIERPEAVMEQVTVHHRSSHQAPTPRQTLLEAGSAWSIATDAAAAEGSASRRLHDDIKSATPAKAITPGTPAKHCSIPRPAVSGGGHVAARSDEVTLVEIGFRAAAAAMRQHLNLCAQVAHIPAVAAFIRQQMFLTEIMLGVGLPSQRPPSSRH